MARELEIVAHRGASAYAPEHSFEAYDLAIAMGADVLELDVRASRDGRIVVLHDRTLARTAGDPRPIADVDFEELDESRRPLELDEVLLRYGSATRWLIDLKEPLASSGQAVTQALARRGLVSCSTVQSFHHRSLRRIRRLVPELQVAPLFCESHGEAQILAGIRRAALYASAVGVWHRACTPAVTHAARDRGLRLRAYTVNDPGEMSRLMRLGAAVITDFPDRARAALLAIEPRASAA